jgi:CheY-like chemotaxis protein
MIRGMQPDLVVLDIRMEHPESGWVVLDLVRLDPKTTHIPVIVCTADAQFVRERSEHLREKRAEVLHKPFDLDDLLEMVRRVLSEYQRDQSG